MTPLGPAIPDLTVRRRRAELMDDPALDDERHRQALDALARVNRVSFSSSRVWREARDLLERGARPVRILDLATGGGDVLLGVARRAAGAGAVRAGDLVLHGCDVSGRAVERARAVARRTSAAGGSVSRGHVELRFFELDVLGEPIPDDYDLVTATLFLHHLAGDEAVGLLRRMADATRRRVFVQDLRRTRLGYVLAWLGLHTLTRSEVARVDGLRSVQSAFTVPEVRILCRDAGLHGACIDTGWPQRFLVRWDRGGAG